MKAHADQITEEESEESKANAGKLDIPPEELEDLIDNVRETLRTAAEAEIKYKEQVAKEQAEAAEPTEATRNLTKSISYRPKVGEKNVFQKPSASKSAKNDRPVSVSAPATPQVGQGAAAKEKQILSPINAGHKVVHDIRNQIKKSKELRAEDLAGDTTHRLNANSEFDILAWQRQRQEYIFEIVELSNKLSDWQSNLGNMSISYRTLTSKINELAHSAEKVSFLTEDLNSLRREHGILRDQMRDSEAKYVKSTNHVRVCLQALIESQTEIDDLKDKMAKAELERAKLIDDSQNLAIKFSIEKADLQEAHRKALAAADRQISKLREQVISLEEEKSRLVEKLSTHVTELAINQNVALAESAKELELLKEQVRILKEEQSSLQISEQDAKLTIVSLNAQVKDLESRQGDATVESKLLIESLKVQLEAMRKEKVKLNDRIKVLVAGKSDSVNLALAKAEEELLALNKVQTDAQVKILQLTTQVNQLEERNRKQSIEANDALELSKKKLHDLMAEKSSIEQEYRARFLTISEQVAEIEKIQSIDRELHALVSEQQAVITEGKIQSDRFLRQISELESERSEQFQESMRNIEKLNNQIQTLQDKGRQDMEEAQIKLDSLTQQIRILEIAKSAAEDKVASLTAQIASLETEIYKYKNFQGSNGSVKASSPTAAKPGATIDELQAQIKALSTEKAAKEKESEVKIQQLSTQLTELNESRRKDSRGTELKLQSLNQRLELLQKEKNQAQARSEELSNELSVLKNEQQAAKTSLNTEVETLRTQLANLHQEKIVIEQDAKIKYNEVSNKLSILEDSYKQKLKASNEEVMSLRSQINTLHEDKASIFSESRRKLDELTQQLSLLTNAIEKQQRNVASAEKVSETSNTTEQVSNMESQQIMIYKLEIQSLEQKYLDAVSQIDAQRLSINRSIEGHQAYIKETEISIENLQSQVAALEREKDKIKEDAILRSASLSRQIAVLEQQVLAFQQDKLTSMTKVVSGSHSESAASDVTDKGSHTETTSIPDLILAPMKERIATLEEEKMKLEQNFKAKTSQMNKNLHALALEVSQRKESEQKIMNELELLREKFTLLEEEKLAIEREYLNTVARLMKRNEVVANSGTSSPRIPPRNGQTVTSSAASVVEGTKSDNADTNSAVVPMSLKDATSDELIHLASVDLDTNPNLSSISTDMERTERESSYITHQLSSDSQDQDYPISLPIVSGDNKVLLDLKAKIEVLQKQKASLEKDYRSKVNQLNLIPVDAVVAHVTVSDQTNASKDMDNQSSHRYRQDSFRNLQSDIQSNSDKQLELLQQEIALLQQENASLKVQSLVALSEAEDKHRHALQENNNEVMAVRELVNNLHKEKADLEFEYMKAMETVESLKKKMALTSSQRFSSSDVKSSETETSMTDNSSNQMTSGTSSYVPISILDKEMQSNHLNELKSDNQSLLIEVDKLRQTVTIMEQEKQKNDDEYMEHVSNLVRQLYVDSQYRTNTEPELEKLRHENSTLQSNVKTMEENYQNIIKSFEEDIKKLNDDNALIQNERAVAETNCSELKSNLMLQQQEFLKKNELLIKENEIMIRDLNDRISELTNSLTELQNTRASKEEKISSLEQMISKKDVEINNLQRKISSTEEKHQSLELELKSMIEQRDNLLKESSNLKIQLNEITNQISQYQGQKSDIQIQLETTLKQSQQLLLEKNSLMERISSLETNYEMQLLHIKTFETNLKSAKDENQELQQENQTLSDTFSMMQDKYSSLQGKFSSVNREYQSVNEQLNGLTDQYSILVQKNITIQEQYATLSHQYEALQIQCNSLNEQISNVTLEKQALEVKYQSQYDELIQEKGREVSLLTQKLNDTEKEMAGILAAKENLSKELETVSAALSQVKNDTNNLLAENSRHIHDLSDKISSLEADLSTITSKYDQQVSEVDSLTQKLLSEQSEKNEYIKKSSSQIAKLNDQLIAYQSDIVRYQENIQKLEENEKKSKIESEKQLSIASEKLSLMKIAKDELETSLRNELQQIKVKHEEKLAELRKESEIMKEQAILSYQNNITELKKTISILQADKEAYLDSKHQYAQLIGQLNSMKEGQARLLRESEVYKRQVTTLQQEKGTIEKESSTKYAQLVKQTEGQAMIIQSSQAKIIALQSKMKKYKKGQSLYALSKYKKSLQACNILIDLIIQERGNYYRFMTDLQEYNSTILSLYDRNNKIEDVISSLREEIVQGEYHVLRTRPSSAKSIESFEAGLARRREMSKKGKDNAPWTGWFGQEEDLPSKESKESDITQPAKFQSNLAANTAANSSIPVNAPLQSDPQGQTATLSSSPPNPTMLSLGLQAKNDRAPSPVSPGLSRPETPRSPVLNAFSKRRDITPSVRDKKEKDGFSLQTFGNLLGTNPSEKELETKKEASAAPTTLPVVPTGIWGGANDPITGNDMLVRLPGLVLMTFPYNFQVFQAGLRIHCYLDRMNQLVTLRRIH